ncbi:MAG TPA: addiction module protein [Gemmataceae bacterium]|jgi:putative addiction module component (TIGR02574 family)|nr:addiction module protein [Gemmataceae bacterium]
MTKTLEMSEAAAELLPKLNALSARDRCLIVQRLQVDIDEPEEDPAEVRATWKAELLRRVEEIDRGKVKPVPIEEMFRKSREKHP